MSLDNISEPGKQIIDQVANAVESTGKKVAQQVSNITEGKAQEVTKEAIQAAVDQAIDVMQIAGDRIREKNINGERVSLEIDVEVLGIAHLKIKTDIPGEDAQ